jgi:hypothetical protein
LPNFFEAVKLGDADWMVNESGNLRQNYGFSMTTKEVESRLDDWQLAKSPIRGIAWYNILANPRYACLFNYIDANLSDKS